MCEAFRLDILSLNPFKNFEGNLQVPLQKHLETAREWLELVARVGAKSIQLPSQFLPQSTGDGAIIVSELRALADLAAQEGISIAYEAVAFAKFNNLWQDSLRVVQEVDRPNFGLCLDSFHIHSRIWGDVTAETGRQRQGSRGINGRVFEVLSQGKGLVYAAVRRREVRPAFD